MYSEKFTSDNDEQQATGVLPASPLQYQAQVVQQRHRYLDHTKVLDLLNVMGHSSEIRLRLEHLNLVNINTTASRRKLLPPEAG